MFHHGMEGNGWNQDPSNGMHVCHLHANIIVIDDWKETCCKDNHQGVPEEMQMGFHFNQHYTGGVSCDCYSFQYSVHIIFLYAPRYLVPGTSSFYYYRLCIIHSHVSIKQTYRYIWKHIATSKLPWRTAIHDGLGPVIVCHYRYVQQKYSPKLHESSASLYQLHNMYADTWYQVPVNRNTDGRNTTYKPI